MDGRISTGTSNLDDVTLKGTPSSSFSSSSSRTVGEGHFVTGNVPIQVPLIKEKPVLFCGLLGRLRGRRDGCYLGGLSAVCVCVEAQMKADSGLCFTLCLCIPSCASSQWEEAAGLFKLLLFF